MWRFSTVGHDCADLLKKGYRQSGVYDVYVADKKFKVFCHMKSNEGWLVRGIDYYAATVK